MKSGKWLEDLVRTVEASICSGSDFKVESSVKSWRRDKDGKRKQIAEFDVVITGKVGSSPVKALYECRDRPSKGKVEAQWLETLVGRKYVHNFTQVSAVSTSGFAPECFEIAARFGVELKEVVDIKPEDLVLWFTNKPMSYVTVSWGENPNGTVFLVEQLQPEMRAALSSFMQSPEGRGAIFRVEKSGEMVRMIDILNAVTLHADGELEEGLHELGPQKIRIPFGPERQEVSLICPLGEWPVKHVDFSCSPVFNVQKIQGQLARYRDASQGTPIAEVATYLFPTPKGDVSVAFTASGNADGSAKLTLTSGFLSQPS